MWNCNQRWVLIGSVFFCLLIASGCNDAVSEPAKDAPPNLPGSRFDAASAGTIHGQVTWAGEIPVVPSFLAPISPLNEAVGERRKLSWDNPNAPVVDAHTCGVGNAIVYVRGIDPARAKPWPHPPVRVEMRDYRLVVHQGSAESPVGFVRRGEAVEMISTQPVFHGLHAGGAAFFTLTFPDLNHPRSRRLTEKGIVELTSAAGYFWMRGYLFVDDHPYFARTNAEGCFTLDGMPAGNYEIVCWMPNWIEARHERDPETNFVTRWMFQPPVIKQVAISVRPGDTQSVKFSLSKETFSR